MRFGRILKLVIILCLVSLMWINSASDTSPYEVLQPEQKQIVEVPDMQYNIFSDKWQYVEEGKSLNYNYFEDKWEWED